jgi:hypothetical protein
MVVELGLDRMGEEYDGEDDAEEDATDHTTVVTPEDAVEEGNAAPEKEDLEMLVPEHEYPQALEVILLEEEPELPSKLPQPSLYTELMRDYEESPSRQNDGV